MADLFPQRDGDLVSWLTNYRAQVDIYKKEMGWDDARVQFEQQNCDELIDAIQANEQKRAAYQAQVAITNAVRERVLGSLRSSIRWIKASPSYKDQPSIGVAFGVHSSSSSRSISVNKKPQFRIKVTAGVVCINYKKGTFDGVNVYMRRLGETSWTFLARDTHSPYEDRSPLLKPGVPEKREYHIVGVVHDEEVGEPSDIVSVTCDA